jgi:RNA recognition motif-containing protein
VRTYLYIFGLENFIRQLLLNNKLDKMVKKVYVGNLPFSYDSDKLKELFVSYGEIQEATVIAFKDTGKSKGFGFVTFANDAEAEKAIAEINKKEVDGRELRVNEATPFDPEKPRERPSFSRGGGFGGGRRFGGSGDGERRPFNRDSNRGSGGGFRRRFD